VILRDTLLPDRYGKSRGTRNPAWHCTGAGHDAREEVRKAIQEILREGTDKDT
jgi:hypothetical protein